MNDIQKAKLKRTLAKLDPLDPLFSVDLVGMDQIWEQTQALGKVRRNARGLGDLRQIPFEQLSALAGNAVRGLALAYALEQQPRGEASGFLCSLLEYPCFYVWSAAVHALTAIGDQGARQAMERAYEQTEDPDLKSCLLGGLARIGGGALPERMEELLRDPDWDTSKAGVALAAQDPSPAVSDLLLEVALDTKLRAADDAFALLREREDPGLLAGLVQALGNGKADAKRRAAQLLGARKERGAVLALMQGLLGSKNRRQRETVIGALGSIGNPKALPALYQIMARPDEDDQVLALACQVVRRLGDSGSIDPLLGVARRPPAAYGYSRSRVAAVEGLCKLADAGQGAELLALLEQPRASESNDMQRKLAGWLAKQEVTAAIGPLQAALEAHGKSGDSSYRRDLERALFKLIQARDAGAVPVAASEWDPEGWLEALGGDSPARLRQALDATRPEWIDQHRARLEELLVHRDEAVRKRCVALFRRHEPAAALASLEARLCKDPSRDYREDDELAYAIGALGLLGDTSVVPALEAHLMAQQGRARRAAAKALKTLGVDGERILAGQQRFNMVQALRDRKEETITKLGELGALRLAEGMRLHSYLWPNDYERALALWERLGYRPESPWEQLIQRFFQNDDDGVRALGRDAVEGLEQLFRRFDDQVGTRAGRLLAAVDGPDYERLMGAILEQRRIAPQLLPELERRFDHRLEPLAEALQDPSERRRAQAAELIGTSKAPRAVGLLAQALEREPELDSSRDTHERICAALGRTGESSAIPALAAYLVREEKGSTEAARALAEIGGKEAILALKAGLAKPSLRSYVGTQLSGLGYRPKDPDEQLFLAAKGGDLATFTPLARQDPERLARVVTELPAPPLVEVIADLGHSALAPLLTHGLLWDHGPVSAEHCSRGLKALEPAVAAGALIEGRERLAAPWFFVHAFELLVTLPCEPTTAFMLKTVQAAAESNRQQVPDLVRGAVKYLGEQRVEQAKAPLIALLTPQQEAPLLKLVIAALARLKATEAVAQLESLQQHKWPKYLEKQLATVVKKLK